MGYFHSILESHKRLISDHESGFTRPTFMEDGIHITNKQGYASAGTSLKNFNKIRSHFISRPMSVGNHVFVQLQGVQLYRALYLYYSM